MDAGLARKGDPGDPCILAQPAEVVGQGTPQGDRTLAVVELAAGRHGLSEPAAAHLALRAPVVPGPVWAFEIACHARFRRASVPALPAMQSDCIEGAETGG